MGSGVHFDSFLLVRTCVRGRGDALGVKLTPARARRRDGAVGRTGHWQALGLRANGAGGPGVAGCFRRLSRYLGRRGSRRFRKGFGGLRNRRREPRPRHWSGDANSEERSRSAEPAWFARSEAKLSPRTIASHRERPAELFAHVRSRDKKRRQPFPIG
ncbi:hypothetical protein GLE_5136 [Lysobacter enzymogenes]|uniref:Uncharacterized protein n=1 Tax=Lysobacter enzymogenes TaxID=69 RepID=A0A0S2DPZ0_LYSEN|nr:hypothetical protein GLE_5136 [Lysobacter enzymogenes]